MSWKPSDTVPLDGSTPLVMMGLSLYVTSENGLFGY